jgi:hypothetical protein
MSENESRNDLKVMVLIGLGGICKQMVEHPATPEEMRQQAQTYVSQFESLLPARGKGNPEDHMQAEMLLEQIARFLSRITELHTYPATGVR